MDVTPAVQPPGSTYVQTPGRMPCTDARSARYGPVFSPCSHDIHERSRKPVISPDQTPWAGWCPEPDLNRYAREGQRGLSSPCLHSTIRAGHGLRVEAPSLSGCVPRTAEPTERCCLILLTSEGASGHGTGHPHLPVALRAADVRVGGMTEFHRLNKGAPPVLHPPRSLSTPSQRRLDRLFAASQWSLRAFSTPLHATAGLRPLPAPQGRPSSPGRRRRPRGPPAVGPRNRSSG